MKKIAHIPEDRKLRGYVKAFPNWENLILGYHSDPRYMNRFGIEYWAVLTKTDKLNKTELSQRLDAFEELMEPHSCSGIVPFTIKNEESADNLRKMLSDRLEG